LALKTTTSSCRSQIFGRIAKQADQLLKEMTAKLQRTSTQASEPRAPLSRFLWKENALLAPQAR